MPGQPGVLGQQSQYFCALLSSSLTHAVNANTKACYLYYFIFSNTVGFQSQKQTWFRTHRRRSNGKVMGLILENMFLLFISFVTSVILFMLSLWKLAQCSFPCVNLNARRCNLHIIELICFIKQTLKILVNCHIT